MSGAAAATLAASVFQPIQAHAQDASRLDEVVVTARRSEERLKDVPLAVSALTSAQLENKSISGLAAVSQYTPGLKFADFVTAFNNTITLRGLQQISVQNPIGNVAVFLDGVYIQRNYMVNSALGDYERIEVVKGPQSALYGQNAFAGAVNYVQKKPTNEFTANILATVGNGGRREVQGGMGGPIIKDKLMARVYAGGSDFDGVWKNNFPGVTGRDEHIGGYERRAASAALRFTPTDSLTFDASYSWNKQYNEIRQYYTIDGNNIQDRYNCGTIIPPANGGSLWCGDLPSNPNVRRSGVGPAPPPGIIAVPQPDSYNSAHVLRLGAEWKATDALTLSYVYGKTYGEAYEQASFDSNPFNRQLSTGPAPTITDQKEGGQLDFESHEARLQWSPQGPVSGEVGYYTSSSRDQSVFGNKGVPTGQPVPLYTKDPLSLNTFAAFTIRDAHYDVDAVFGRVNLKLLDDRATITGEVRYTTTDVQLKDLLALRTNPNLPLLKASFDDYSPRVSAKFQISPDVMAYASAARGVKAGGFNGYVSGAITLTPAEQSFDPEENWTYEFGVKGAYFERKLTADVSLFYVDWSKKQSSVVPSNSPNSTIQGIVPPRIFLTNGQAKSYGVEVSGALYAMEGLRFDYSVSLQNPEYGDATFSPDYARVCDNVVCSRTTLLKGKTLEQVSKVSATVGFEYKNQLSNGIGWFIGADETYRGKQFANALNTTSIEAVALTDARAGLEKDGWRAFVWVRNAFDKEYVVSAFVIPTILQYNVDLGEKRTFGLTVSAKY